MKRSLLVIGIVLFSLIAMPLLADDDKEVRATSQFNQLDINSDGYLSKDEIKTQPEVARGLSISRYGGFELADVNADEKLEKAEFAAFEEPLPVE